METKKIIETLEGFGWTYEMGIEVDVFMKNNTRIEIDSYSFLVIKDDIEAAIPIESMTGIVAAERDEKKGIMVETNNGLCSWLYIWD